MFCHVGNHVINLDRVVRVYIYPPPPKAKKRAVAKARIFFATGEDDLELHDEEGDQFLAWILQHPDTIHLT